MPSFTYAIGDYVVWVEGETVVVSDPEGPFDLLSPEEEHHPLNKRLQIVNERLRAMEEYSD